MTTGVCKTLTHSEHFAHKSRQFALQAQVCYTCS